VEIKDKEKLLIEEVKVNQEIIKRMSGNSLSVKTWTMTLIVATLIFKGNHDHVFIAFIPLIVFWVLDAYYLRQERLFRKNHEWIINHRLTSEEKIFDLNTKSLEDKVDSIYRIMFSISVLPFYGGIAFLLFVYMKLQ